MRFNLRSWSKRHRSITFVTTIILPTPLVIVQLINVFTPDFDYIKNAEFSKVGIIKEPAWGPGKTICISENGAKVNKLNFVPDSEEMAQKAQMWQKVKVLEGNCEHTIGFVHIAFIHNSEFDE